MKKYLITILFAIALGGTANGAPAGISVTGDLEHGISKTITLVGAGAKATASAIRFETYELSDIAQQPIIGNRTAGEISYWEDLYPGNTDNPTISGTDTRNSRSNRHTNHFLKRESGIEISSQLGWKDNVGFATTGKTYLNLWVRFDWPNKSPTNYYQVKTFSVLHEITSDGSLIPDFQLSNWWYVSTPDYSQTYYRNQLGAGTSQSPHFPNNAIQITNDEQWYNFTVQLDAGTNNTEDGSYECYLTDATGGAMFKISANSVIMRDNGETFDALKLGWYIGSTLDDGEVNMAFDNIYMDNSWARVEIGDSAVYDMCTHREIQIPTRWDATGDRIDITVNQGSFADGGAFLFVVDEAGDASAGYPVTFATGTNPVVTLEPDKQATSPTTYTGTVTAETGRTITGVVSSNGFTVTPDDGTWDEQTEAFTVSGATVPITDICTATDSIVETGQDSITITLPSVTTATVAGCTIGGGNLK